MEWAAWVGVVVAVVAALVALEGARRAQSASSRATEEASAARQQAEAAQRQAQAAGRHAAAATDQARAVATSVDDAHEQLALARQQVGNVGAVDVEWVQQWRHGPVFGLLRLQAVGHHPLHGVHLSIIAPRGYVGGVPAVAVLGDTPVDASAAQARIGLPQGGNATLPSVMHTDVPVGDLGPGAAWHALVMCLSEADAIVLIMDWSVGPARDRERARTEVALPPPLRSPTSPA
jgi:hypothetical protein